MFIAKTYGDGSKYNEGDIYGPEASVFDFDIGSITTIISDDSLPYGPIYTDAGLVYNDILVLEPTVSGQVGQRPLSAIFDANIFDLNIFV